MVLGTIAAISVVAGSGVATYRYFDGPKRRKIEQTLQAAAGAKAAEFRRKLLSSTSQEQLQSSGVSGCNGQDASLITDSRGRQDDKLLDVFNTSSPNAQSRCPERVYTYRNMFDNNGSGSNLFSITDSDDDEKLIDLNEEPSDGNANSRLCGVGNRGDFVEVNLRDQKETPKPSFKANPPHDKRQDYIEGINSAKC